MEEKAGWLEQRLKIKKQMDWFLYRKVPRGVGWWYTLGSATAIAFVIQVVTGVLLMMNYSPSPDHAYDSVTYTMTQVTFGHFIRSVHFYTASAMVILIAVHLVRVFFMAAYKYPRELTWVVGSILLFLVLGSSFTGYLLPWDQRAYWATNIAVGLTGNVPLIGGWIQQALVGGTQIGALTLTRFFTFHVGIIPGFILVLIIIHVVMVVRHGISTPPGRFNIAPAPGKSKEQLYEQTYEASKKGGESFFPDTVAKDALFGLVVIAIIFALAIIFPHGSEAPADPSTTTYTPRPEWYFLFFFQFLKLFPGSLEALAAVAIPTIGVIVVIAVPFLDRSLYRVWTKRKPAVIIGIVVILGIGALSVAGALTAPNRPEEQTDPLVLNGQKVYKDINCAYCHTINGVGGAVGPDLSNVASQLSKAQITGYLLNPNSMVPNSLHPKLQFTPDELNGLVAYLQTLGEAPSYSALAAGLFQQNCSGCHKVNGQGGTLGPDLTSVGTRHDLSFFAPFISNPSSVLTGATMPAFQNKLSQDQINDLAAYLSSLRGATATPTPSATSAPAPSVTSSGTIDTAALYHTYCEGCHGVNQQGGIGPALTPSALADSTASDLVGTITNGEDQMPSFSNRLSAAQISAMANFLKNPPSSAPGTAASPTATSAAISGAQIFSTYCAGCHGVSRQGGIGPALTVAALANNTSTQLVTIITSGKGNMPSFSAMLNSDQINAVANYIKTSP